MTRALALAALVGGCAPRGAPVAAAVAAPTTASVAVAFAWNGPSTAVVRLPPNAIVPVVSGPFAISSINPGRSLSLSIGANACAGVVAWFEYSGGGVAIGPGQTLCARNDAGQPMTHGFTGRVP
jgi:hypothetical protein